MTEEEKPKKEALPSRIIKQAAGQVLILYVMGVFAAELFFVLIARISCVQNEGWSGLFWCPDSVISVMFTGFFKALVWPIILWHWISN